MDRNVFTGLYDGVAEVSPSCRGLDRNANSLLAARTGAADRNAIATPGGAGAYCSAMVVLLLVLPAKAAAPASVARDIVGALHLQKTMPGPGVALEQTQQWHFALPFEDIVIVIGLLVVVLGLGFGVWTVRDRLPVIGRKKLQADAEPTNRAVSVVNMVASQLEADDLAGPGLLTEAMHTLLLRSLIEMRKTLEIGIQIP